MSTPSNPGWATGFVPSAAQWAAVFSGKVDYPAPVGQGGTGITATPANGQLLIGTGSGFRLNRITAGTGISISVGSGSITISSTGSTGAGTVYSQLFSGTGSQTAFTLVQPPYSEDNTQVYINGIYQQKNTYSVSGSTLTFSTAPVLGTNNIEVVVIQVLPIGETTANLVSFAPTGSISATNVQSAIVEVVDDLASTATGKGAALVGYLAPGTGGVAKTVEDVLDENVRVNDYGTVQQAANYAASTTVTGPPITPGGSNTVQTVLPRVELGPSIYQYSTPLISYYGQIWRGHGNNEAADRLNTKLYPASNTDGIRLQGNSYIGNSFWNGKFEDFSIFGYGTQTSPNYYSTFAAAIAAVAVGSYFTCDEGTPGLIGSYQRISIAPYYQNANRGWYPYGWGINAVSPDGTIEVAVDGQATFSRLNSRQMGSGGIRIAKGALQTLIADCNSLNAGGYGLYYKAPYSSSQQSMVIERFSADGSAGGAAVYIDTPQIGGHLSIRDLKSESNINQAYSAKTTITASCSGTALTTTGNPPLRRGSVIYTGTSPSSGTYLGTVVSGSGNSWVLDVGGTVASPTAMTAFYKLDQKNALVLENAASDAATVWVDGLTHISAGTYFLGGTNPQMTGDAISISGGNTPDLIWNNVQIRTLAGQTITPPTDFTGGCVATIGAGAVSGISEGNTVGWTVAPTVDIAPPDTAGTQATATAVAVNGRLVFTIVNPGSGYTAAPVVTLSAPPAAVVDTTYGNRIESKFTTGRYSNKTRGDFSRNNGVFWCLGSVYDYISPSIEGPGWQLGGQTPGISLYSKTSAANTRKVLLVNSGGNFSIRTVTDAGASTIALSVNNNAGVTNGVQIRRALNSFGTTLIPGNWALSAGFGSTAAVTINASSKDSRFDINVAVSGTGIAANPTATLTFSDGAFVTAPIGVVVGWNDTDSTGVSLKWVESTTTLVITFLGTPVTGKTYRIKGVLM